MRSALEDAIYEKLSTAVDERPKDIRDQTHPKQDAFVMDPARMVAALTSRRGGKSNGLAYRFYRTMKKHPGCFCVYIALTRESAKNIMWQPLQEIAEKHDLGAKFTESNLTVSMPNGSRLQLFGADMKNFIRRLRGIKTPGVGIDEAQEFGSHLETLIDDVLTPALADYEGQGPWVALTGTPGPVLSGYFYEVTERLRHGYHVHRWTLFENPYLPHAQKFVDDLKLKKAWSDDHPTLLREYYGKWTQDLDALVFKYLPDRNTHSLPTERQNDWSYVVGVDLGFHDADAIAVIGWHKHEAKAYLVKELIEVNQGITELAEALSRVVDQFDPLRIVMDTGGLGKKVAEEIRRRYQIPVLAAEKTRKHEFIELLNDALRTGRFFASHTSRFADDCGRVKWDYERSTPDRKVISEHFHSDITDAVLYAYREAMHWLSEPEEVKPKTGTPEWFEAQEDEHMERIRGQLEAERQDEIVFRDPFEW